jgi:hypothetical protein
MRPGPGRTARSVPACKGLQPRLLTLAQHRGLSHAPPHLLVQRATPAAAAAAAAAPISVAAAATAAVVIAPPRAAAAAPA